MKKLMISIFTLILLGACLTARGITLNLSNARLNDALRLLFASSSKSYSLSDIDGTVNVSLTNVPFDIALNSILRSTGENLTYTLTGNVYEIGVKHQTQMAENILPPSENISVSLPKTYVKIKVNFADAGEIAMLMGGTPIISEYYGTAGMLGMTGGGMGEGVGGGFGDGFGGNQGGFGSGFGGNQSGFGNNQGGFGGQFGEGFGGGQFGGGGFGNNSFVGGGYGGGQFGGFGNSGLGRGYYQ
jgi:hypothetical protein